MEQDGIRLNKYLSEAGTCSRREADRLIAAEKVSVNGETAVAGQRVSSGDLVVCEGRNICPGQEEPVLLLVNKPRGIVCTTSHKDRAPNIVDLVDWPVRVYPIGRLDKDSEGLILMTNQGDLVNKMMRGSNGHEKEYQVTVDQRVTDAFVRRMEKGVPVLDTVTKPCKVKRTGERSFRIVLTQGLNRQIRRMCSYLGYEVVSLKRTRVMNIRLGDLKTGSWRRATQEEWDGLARLISGSVNQPDYPEGHAAGRVGGPGSARPAKPGGTKRG